MLNLQFFGAAREVTGSCHLLHADGIPVMLDCGLFQGRRAEALEKSRRFPIDPARLKAVVLSHAHIDHCGRLPLLVKQGFAGPIYATPATRDLCAVMLADAAHIQEEDAKFVSRKRAKIGELPVEPLFNDEDARAAMRLFRTVNIDNPFFVTRRLKVIFREAGHMLGSTHVTLEYSSPSSDTPIRLVFSGDLGRFGLPILRDPVAIDSCDYLIIESTYGGRRHPPTSDLPGQLAETVNDTVRRGGKVIIPAFSVGRTQVIVYTLHKLQSEGLIPRIPIYVDSPLSVDATEVFRLHSELFDTEARAFQASIGDILGCSSCNYIREAEVSKRLNTSRQPSVIISSSGMCETGRIVHHIRNNIQSPKNTILIVGFQAAHTLGRRLVERDPHVNIFGQKLKLRARVVVLNGFSSHADRDELRKMTLPLASQCKRVFLVHGELDQMEIMRDSMKTDGFREVEMPEPGTKFDLS